MNNKADERAPQILFSFKFFKIGGWGGIALIKLSSINGQSGSHQNIGVLSLVILYIGLSLLFFSILVYPWERSAIPIRSFNGRGFIFTSSENLTSSLSEFKLIITNVDCKNDATICKIIVDPFLIDASEYTSAYFLLQIPYNISNVEVYYLAGKPEDFNGTKSINSGNVSYISVDLPKNCLRFGNAGALTLVYIFTVESKSAFSTINQYTYEFPIIWGGSLNKASEDTDYVKNDIKLYWELHFFNISTAFLHVERSTKYYYSQIRPPADRITVWENHTTYYWNLEPISAQGGESSLIIEITDLSTKDRIDLRRSIVWLTLGIGIPLVVSSIIEILKNKDRIEITTKSIEYIFYGIWIVVVLPILLFLIVKLLFG